MAENTLTVLDDRSSRLLFPILGVGGDNLTTLAVTMPTDIYSQCSGKSPACYIRIKLPDGTVFATNPVSMTSASVNISLPAALFAQPGDIYIEAFLTANTGYEWGSRSLKCKVIEALGEGAAISGSTAFYYAIGNSAIPQGNFVGYNPTTHTLVDLGVGTSSFGSAGDATNAVSVHNASSTAHSEKFGSISTILTQQNVFNNDITQRVDAIDESITGITGDTGTIGVSLTGVEQDITALQTSVKNIEDSRGKSSGIAMLDTNSKIPMTNIPSPLLGAMIYQGAFDASQGTYPANTGQGCYYVVSVAGILDAIDYKVGDWIVSNGTTWDKVDNSDKVSSVNDKIGAVSLTYSDVGADAAGTADTAVTTHNSNASAHSTLFGNKQDKITRTGILKGDGSGGINVASASDMGILDAAGYFTGTNVEAALQETGAALGDINTGLADLNTALSAIIGA